MTANNPTLREALNTGGGPYQLADINKKVCMGDLIARLIAASAADETALNPNGGGQDINLAAAPSCLLDVVAQAGTFTGRMTMVIDSRPTADIDPIPSGTVVWSGPGSPRVRFNATDAITDLDVWYTIPADAASILERTLSQDF